MDFWRSGEIKNNESMSSFEAAVLGTRPMTALATLAAVSFVILVSAMYLPDAWLDSDWFRVLMPVSFKLAVARWIHADALARGWLPSRAVFYVCFTLILVLIGYPAYLLMSRGWKGALVTGFRGLGLLLLVLILAAVVSLVVDLV
ncbi:hypothetical protein Y5W_02826 [Alcanivorax sp. 521-1]|jgi:hypothetical protein|uniref:Uncharacterized protein n=2 Tax=Alloalcanivorax profundimaris TaxID=2735259 RepID=A0ABS0AVA0_9GAMM|nr:hypothetical protein [Alcanivorax sp.]MBF47479.1 hypothetical protein [Alcanivorax sp.]MBF5057532.1 hypothetical protein [Alloalcanivorax profundimaris]HAB09259.1 hypothetical protein [Alcanivorax sp.]HAD44360.1 hypothetical protein [Alcanivorax sp.]|tara:strand:+ start:7541 stop:7975 length:435 start_codon:yes stop_codon:yes gene_type:complete